MRILHMFPVFSSTFHGGVFSVGFNLSRALQARGHHVAIYTTGFKFDPKLAESSGLEVHPFPVKLNLSGFSITPSLVGAMRNGLREFDIIHCHNLRGFQEVLLWHFARKHKIPYIIDAHGSTSRAVKKYLTWSFDLAFGYRILKGATRVIAETESGAKEYEAMGVDKERIVLLYPPFPVEEYADLPPQGRFRERFGIKEKHILLYLGRISRIKGVDFIVRSFGRLRQGREDVFLVLAGPDEGLKAELEGIIQRLGMGDKVLFTGFISGVLKKEALVDATLMVQMSLYEQGLAWACVEALLCCKPIVVSQGTGAEEDVHKMGGGYVVEFGNEDELSQRLNRILDEPEEPLALAARMRQYILENLSLSSKVGEYERIYRQCIEEYGATVKGE